MARRRRIFIDLDDVVFDLLTDFALLCNERLDTKITRESFTDWDWSTLLGFPPEVFQNLLSTPGLFAKLKPMPGAIAAIKLLMRDDRYDVLFLSASTSRTSCSEKRNCVRQHFGHEGAERLILATRKDVIGKEDDMLIDDRPKNIMQWGGGLSILFDAPHNQTFQYHYRMKSWEEILVSLGVQEHINLQPNTSWDANGSPI